MFSDRLNRRLLRHHLPLALVTLGCGYVLYATRPYPDVISRLSFASAWPALILLCLTLVIGPWKMLARQKLTTSFDLRRDIGIWAGLTGLFHTGFGQFAHLRGRPWLYYIYDNWQEEHIQPFRLDRFGFSNDTGLIASLILLALLATSNDAALRKLGTPGWKKLQRWNYACFAFTALHTFGYMAGGFSQRLGWVTLAVAAIGITAALQYIGWRQRRAI
jgi:methionine sulfoxide reductase heme-binding subunit